MIKVFPINYNQKPGSRLFIGKQACPTPSNVKLTMSRIQSKTIKHSKMQKNIILNEEKGQLIETDS